MVIKEIPPKVEYSLTELGGKFLPVLEALEKWAIEYKNQKLID
jgi:DNA-binding HxlR family transcriptional regulator